MSGASPNGPDISTGGDLFLQYDLEAGSDIYYSGDLTDLSPGPAFKGADGSAEVTAAEARGVLDRLTPVVYTSEDTEDGKTTAATRVGFVAEDIPEMIAGPDGKGYRPIDLVAVLTKIVQEQQATIEDLEARLSALE
jgi:hypothetical protein